FNCAGMLTINTSGIVLRGRGSGLEKGPATTIKMIGPRHRAILIGRGRQAGGDRAANDDEVQDQEPTSKPEFESAKTSISNAYVPAGTTSFSVADAKGFEVGDTIAIRRPTTPAWVHLMGMD